MARWVLTQPHYIMTIPSAKYRYEETDRDTGERNVAEFDVQRLLDPKNPRDCRSPEGCVVTNAKPTVRGDWQFVGDPTPDMDPLDPEAIAISDSFREKWVAPMSDTAFPAQGSFGDALLTRLEKQLTAVMAAAPTVQPVSTAGVSAEDFAKLQEQVAALMAQNAELKASSDIRR